MKNNLVRAPLCLLLALTFSAIVCCAQQRQSHSGPSLKDTEAWMARTVNSGPLHPGTGHGTWESKSGSHYVLSRTSIVFGQDAQHLDGTGCYAKSVEINELSPKGNAAKKGYTTQTVLVFSLKDIDPSRVMALPEAFVTFYAADDKPAIRKQQSTWNADDYFHTSEENLISCAGPGKECTKKEDALVKSDLAVDSLEFAQRFAKAFRHAVELCGGKPSTF